MVKEFLAHGARLSIALLVVFVMGNRRYVGRLTAIARVPVQHYHKSKCEFHFRPFLQVLLCGQLSVGAFVFREGWIAVVPVVSGPRLEEANLCPILNLFV